MSVEDQVDGLREASETIASKCDVTFELYRNYTVVLSQASNYTVAMCYLSFHQMLLETEIVNHR